MTTKKWLKRGLITLVVLLLLAFAGGAIFLLTLDPEVYKEKLVNQIEERYHRKLDINGELKLSLFPRIGLSASDLSLSEPNSSQNFVTVGNVRMGVALWPLLQDRFVIDHADVDGLNIHIRRDEDGGFNFDDFFREQDQGLLSFLGSSNEQNSQKDGFNVDVAGLNFTNGQIDYHDLRKGQSFVLQNFEANTGHITERQAFDVTIAGQLKTPSDSALPMDSAFKLNGMVQFDPVQGIYNARELTASLSGRTGLFDMDSAVFKGTFDINDHNKTLEGRDFSIALDGKGRPNTGLGSIKLSVDAPKINFDKNKPLLLIEGFALNGNLASDNKQSYQLELKSSKLDVSPVEASGEPLTGVLKFRGNEKADLNLSFDKIGGAAHNLTLGDVKVDGTYEPSRYHKVSLDFKSAGSIRSFGQEFSVDSLYGKVTSQLNKEPAQELQVAGTLKGNLPERKIDLNMYAMMDKDRLALTGGLEGFVQPKVHFDVQAEHLTLDDILSQISPHTAQRKKAVKEDNTEAASAASAQPKADDSADKTAAESTEQQADDSDQASADSSEPQTAKADKTASDTTAPEVANTDKTASGTSKPQVANADKTGSDTSEQQSQQADVNSAQPPSGLEHTTLQQLLLKRLSGVGTFNIENLVYRGTTFKNLGATLIFDSSDKVEVKSLKADTMGGKISLRSELELNGRAASVTGNLHQVSLEELLPLAGLPMSLSGQGDMDVDLKSTGTTADELKQNMQGKIVIKANEGELRGIDIPALIDHLNEYVTQKDSKLPVNPEEYTPFTSLDSRMNIQNGLLKFDAFRLQGEELDIKSLDEPNYYNLQNGQFTLPISLKAVRHACVDQACNSTRSQNVTLDLMLKGSAEGMILQQGTDSSKDDDQTPAEDNQSEESEQKQ